MDQPTRPTCDTCLYFNRYVAKGSRSPHDTTPDECRISPVSTSTYEHQWCGQHPDFPDYIAAIKAAKQVQA